MWLYAEIKTLADIPRHYARTQPKKVALIDPLGARTFAELDRASNRLANAILACGIEPGSHIGFLGKNSARYFETLFAAGKAGCALAPINWRLSEAELQLVIDDAKCPLILVDKEFSASLAGVRAGCATSVRCVQFDSTSSEPQELDELLQHVSDGDPHRPLAPEATAVLMYTSGTTGKPKGVMLSHQGFSYMRLCEHLEPALRWHPDDVMLMAMPNFHLVGTGLSVQSLYNGSTVSIL
ncbi:MAG: AMP-binding protein, partial [Steroidobacteraceae bacterium]